MAALQIRLPPPTRGNLSSRIVRPFGMRSNARLVTLVLASLLPHPAAAQLVVTSPERGVLRLSPDGDVQQVLSATPASWGRRRGERSIVFLSAERNELREIDLVDGRERAIAALPSDLGLGCGGMFGSRGEPGEPYSLAHHLFFEASMVVDDTRACFEVMDRNLNMVSVIVQVEVALATGAVTHHVTASDECGSMDRAAIDALPCTRLLRAASQARARSRQRRAAPWSIRGEGSQVRLVGPGGRQLPLAIEGAAIESTSADGRWSVVGGQRDEGDYIYRLIYLLDRRRGALFALPALEGSRRVPWPAPLPRGALADPEQILPAGTMVTGETSIAWIDAGRTLVIGGNLLVWPGRGFVRLPGTLVR